MKILILDTSSPFLYVGIMDGEKEVYQKVLEGKNNHSEHLMNTIEEGFFISGFGVKELDQIIVGIGPGSYTGLRISLVVAKMFSWTLHIPLYTVSSLEILSSGHFVKDGIYAIANVAKKHYVYAKVVEVKNQALKTIIEEQFILEAEFLASMEQKNNTYVDSKQYLFDGAMIVTLPKTLVEDIHAISPNYLRKDI